LRQAAERRESLVARVRLRFANQPALAGQFEALLAMAATHVVVDEDHNAILDQMGNAALRPAILELGARLTDRGATAQRDDVFMLTVDDIHGGLAGRDLRDLVRARRAEFEAWSTVAPPPTLGPPSQLGAATDPFQRSMLKMDGRETLHGPHERTLRGLAGAPGVAEGRARVALSLDEAMDLEPGEILVCEMTLPAWTPALSIAAAVVADTGGALSHSAIVARELGIPCVVGLGNASRVLRSGQWLRVDGSAGVVDILEG
jgi:pyruvate,water dikinase